MALPHQPGPLPRAGQRACKAEEALPYLLFVPSPRTPPWSSRQGQLDRAGPLRLGHYCTVYPREKAGDRGAWLTLTKPFCSPSASSSFSPNVLPERIPSKPCPSLRFPGNLPSPEAQPAPIHLGGATHSASECVSHECTGHTGAGCVCLAHVLFE